MFSPEKAFILERFDEVVRETPEKLAVVDISGETAIRLTYKELSDLADRAAMGLLELGVDSGEFVAFQMANGWEFITITLALWRVGACPCPLLPQLREREVSFITEAARCRVLICADEYRGYYYQDMIQRVRKLVPSIETVITLSSTERDPSTSHLGGLMRDKVDAKAIADRAPHHDGFAQLLFTSGTTGEPKGVLHTHRTLAVGLESHIRTLQLTSEDSVWVPSPLAHQTGLLYGMMLSFALGATGIYQAKWSVEGAVEAIETHGARFVQAAMPFLSDITNCERPPVGLKLFVATGAAIPRQLANSARERLGCAVVGAWGSTESCLVTVGRPSDPPDKLWQTDGRVIDGMEIRVVDEQDHDVRPGVEGRYLVRTRAMFIGYLNHPEWYAKAVSEDGFYDTGDLATMDAEGYIRLTGRQKDVINRGGEKIPVAELENLLYEHPAIRDTAVVGMPDPRLGERTCAFVVLRDRASVRQLSDVTTYLEKAGVTKLYWPERLEIVDELPRTASGKIQKYLLRSQVAEKLRAEGFIS